MRLIKNLQNFSHRNELWKKKDKILLGVSGGPDSVCLLDVFAKLKKKYSLELAVAHVNYRLRGKDSEKDAAFVKKLAEKHNLKFFGLSAERKNKKTSEDSFRQIRYDFFEKTRKRENFDSIAVAHNADDQVETFLMRMIRGSGLAGLSSMKARNERVIRPLLGTFRREILKYLKENHLPFRVDKTNRENLFLRNKIRNRLIPFLEKNFNPRVKETMRNYLPSIQDDLSFLEDLARKNFAENRTLRIKKILSLPSSLQKRVLLEAIKFIRGDAKNIQAGHVEEILKIIKSPKNKRQIAIFQRLKVEKNNDRVVLKLNKK